MKNKTIHLNSVKSPKPPVFSPIGDNIVCMPD